MFYNQFKITIRQLLKNKSTTFINFAGLSIGLAATFFIALYVLNEWQTDRSIPHPERTYRVLRVSDINNDLYQIGVTSAPFATALQQDFASDIEETVRVLDGNSIVQLDDRLFEENQYYYADANFLTFFGFKLLYGNEKMALSEPRNIVLTRETARRYFGDEKQAMGKTLKIDNNYEATVTGVLETINVPLHLDFDMVESTAAFENANWWQGWWNNTLCTYLRLQPGASAIALEERLPTFMDKYFGADFERTNTRIDLRLEPIRSVYFAANTRYDPMRHGDKKAVNIFLLAALLLVVIACANYINLSTAKAVERAKTIGIYKVLGSGRPQIVLQMMIESLLLVLFSVFLASQLVLAVMPWFSEVFGVNLSINLSFSWILAALLGFALLVAIMAGFYPGLFLSSFKPAVALKGNNVTGERQTVNIRKGLIVFQFVLSVALLCSTIFIQQQLDFLKNKKLGFDKDHILTLRLNNPELNNNRATFKQRMLQEPGVTHVSFMSGTPGGFHDATSVDLPEVNQTMRMRTAFTDFDFVKTFDLDIIAGRDFNAQLATDSTRAVLLNEQAVADLGLTAEEVLGKKIILTSYDSISRNVVGVLKNYHFSSLHDVIEPLVVSTNFRGRTVAIKAQAERIPQVIAAAESAWTRHSSAFPFNYAFLDESLDRLYQSEVRQGRVFALFAGIAIFIACLGMFGLAAFAASTRKKEISIRKVLGASVENIVALLSKDFLKLVVIALVIAAPLAWYFMEQWLMGFAYRIDIQPWVFVLGGVIAIGIAFLTVSFQSVKAALANPVESLKSE